MATFDPIVFAVERLPLVMGILNVTPDSFSDGGAYVDPDAAAAHAARMHDDGAAIIDIGAESTRPGAQPVSADEQIRRVLPVIERVRSDIPTALLSLDTRSSDVARTGLDAGVAIINDISALRDDPRMAQLIAERGAGVVLMHMQGTPATMQVEPHYANVVAEVAGFLRERAEFAAAQGIAPGRIILDPGIGFGKRLTHNLALLGRMEVLVALGYPILLGASRKSFIAQMDPSRPAVQDRLGGSLACVARAFAAGAALVRVHDVFATRQLLALMRAMSDASA